MPGSASNVFQPANVTTMNTIALNKIDRIRKKEIKSVEKEVKSKLDSWADQDDKLSGTYTLIIRNSSLWEKV